MATALPEEKPMSHPDYAITYQPLFTTLQAIDVQALIDQAGDPMTSRGGTSEGTAERKEC